LSRSSALASKATGYPLAFVATKLMLGKRLTEVKNNVTGTTSAFFEPALDYLAVKIPRWDLAKLKHSDHAIGSEMKSVGEVMGLGRSFPEALQKAIRMLNIGADGLSKHPYSFSKPMAEVSPATDRRLFALYEVLKKGKSVAAIHAASQIDPWFLNHMAAIAATELDLQQHRLNQSLLRRAKQQGFSDAVIGELVGQSATAIRQRRLSFGLRPVSKQIDTLAGEVAAQTNYLYMTYHGSVDDIVPLPKSPVIVLGSGPYCIGSSVEFDWCAVTMATTIRRHDIPCVVINSNPETVSTDFDRSDRLYFEELTLERVMDIADAEQTRGIVVSTGGQIANNLAVPLAAHRYPILGTAAKDIDRAEDRQKFSTLLGDIGVDQPAWQEATTLRAAKQFAKKVGYPVLIRPSYVLSGGAMNVVTDAAELEAYLSAATRLSPDHPVVISKFITDAKELEIDGVAWNGEIQIYAISEHIENAGVHSGDATVVLPPQRLYLETVRRAKHIARQVASGLAISGPFNIQFIAKDNDLKVIECNVRASRSFPFVSKVVGVNFIEVAAEIFLGTYRPKHYQTLDLDHVGVKSPQFSYNRLKGADPVAGVEMASTGEVATLGEDLLSTFLTSWEATEQKLNGRRLFLSVADAHKHKFIEEVRNLQAAGWEISTTTGTRDYLAKNGIQTKHLAKIGEANGANLEQALIDRQFDLLVNIPTPLKKSIDGFKIRRLAIDNHLPMVSNAEVAVILLRSLAARGRLGVSPPRSWQEYHPANGSL
jgi:carbamoyl-phosphate synthase large subunit